MKTKYFILSLCIIALTVVLAQWLYFRIDLTSDHRHSLSNSTRQILKQTDKPIEITLYLSGNLNSGFLRLKSQTQEVVGEMNQYANIKLKTVDVNDLTQPEQQQLQQSLAKVNLSPTAIYERDSRGNASQTIVYPYALVKYNNRQRWVNLLQNQKGVSGAENLNRSIEALEYVFVQTIYTLSTNEHKKIAFIEGHGELPEQNTQDVQQALSEWFDVYRGAITTDARCLNDFAAIVIADPQQTFTEEDKFVIDQYIMQGGKVLWCVSGVQFSEDILTDNGYTPALALDLNLGDMFFKYGVRINNRLVQSLQCISVPVDVSRNPQIPQYEPMPWVYAPLLETSYNSSITRNLSPVLATFASDIEFVGDDEELLRQVLLATADYSRLIATPNEIDLTDLSVEPQLFNLSYLPIGVAEEGVFYSIFTHRMKPQAIENCGQIQKQSVRTRQIFVAVGNIARNEIQQNQTLPAGYDRYSRTQFANRDFIVNSILWLTDDNNMLELKQKQIPLRLLNQQALQQRLLLYQIMSTIIPLLLLALVALAITIIRKRKYTKI